MLDKVLDRIKDLKKFYDAKILNVTDDKLPDNITLKLL